MQTMKQQTCLAEFRSFGERMVSVTSRYVRIREETKTVKGKVNYIAYYLII